MRTVLAFLLLLFAAPAWALTPEEAAYIAARDKAAAALDQKWDSAAHDRAIAALTLRLRRIIGPAPKGFAGAGEVVRDSLCCGVGSNKLDALAFGDAVVTTEGLARHWLGDKPNAPVDLDARIREGDGFYAGLIGDAGVGSYAQLPIATPAGATLAVAHIALASQSGAFWPPRQVGVILRKGGRLLLFFDDAVTVPELPVCEPPLAAALAKADAEVVAGRVDRASQIGAEAESTYVSCWGAHIREATAYPALLQQAQRVADSLAAD